MHSHLLRILLALCLLTFPPELCGQKRPITPEQLPLELRKLATGARTIFSGRVVSVKANDGYAARRVATVTVTLRIENAVRGVGDGQTYSFSEWAGLWSGRERYRVGQRLMLFLYPPSPLGLTSPVGGDAGRLVVDEKGHVLSTIGQAPSNPLSPGSPRIGPDGIGVKDLARALRKMRQE